jgi:hypothetical protein
MSSNNGYYLGAGLMFAGLALVTIGITIAPGEDDNMPSCPTEDSCHANYHNGSWYIIEDPNGTFECDDFERPGVEICVDGETGEVVEGKRVTTG